jgi:hypothetical protein
MMGWISFSSILSFHCPNPGVPGIGSRRDGWGRVGGLDWGFFCGWGWGFGEGDWDGKSRKGMGGRGERTEI